MPWITSKRFGTPIRANVYKKMWEKLKEESICNPPLLEQMKKIETRYKKEYKCNEE